MFYTRALWICLGLVWSAQSAFADPVWIPPKKTFHLATSVTMAFWDQFLQRGVSSVDMPGEITQYEFTAYAEYVPIENLSIDLTLPVVISQRKFVYLVTDGMGRIIDVSLGPGGEIRNVDTNAGLGDVTLSAKWVFWDRYVSLGIRPFVKFPGTYEAGEISNSPGDGQTDLGAALLAGSYIMPINTYIRASFALVQRFGDPSNQFEIMVEPGVHITQRLTARFLYQHIEQFDGTDILFYGLPNYYPGNEEDADRIGAGLSYQASNLLTIFGLYQQTVAGRNTANIKAFTLGLDFTF